MNARTEAESAALRAATREQQERAAIFAMTDRQVILTAQRVRPLMPYIAPKVIPPKRFCATSKDMAALDELLSRQVLDADHVCTVLDAVHRAYDPDIYHGWRYAEAEKLQTELEELGEAFGKFAEES